MHNQKGNEKVKENLQNTESVAGVCSAGGTVPGFGVQGDNRINSAFGEVVAGSIVLGLVIRGCGATV